MSDERSPEAIQDDIEQTREQLSEDLDALGQKLSPEGLKEEAKTQLEDLKEVAVDTAQQAARELTGQVEAVGEDLVERIRENPLPLTLVGAALGLGWLLMRSAERPRQRSLVTGRDATLPDHEGIVDTPTEADTTVLRPGSRQTSGIVLGSDGRPVDQENPSRYDLYDKRDDTNTFLDRRAVWIGAGAALAGALIGLAVTGGGAPQGQRDSAPQSRGFRVRERVRINKPAAELYAFWRDFENLPKVMRHLESVTSYGSGRSRWVAKGPAGSSVSWNAVLTGDRPNESLAWRSEKDSQVPNEGAVAFRAVGAETTDLIVSLTYHPPGGALGAAVANLFGRDPSSQISDDLEDFKARIERGSLLLKTSET